MLNRNSSNSPGTKMDKKQTENPKSMPPNVKFEIVLAPGKIKRSRSIIFAYVVKLLVV